MLLAERSKKRCVEIEKKIGAAGCCCMDQSYFRFLFRLARKSKQSGLSKSEKSLAKRNVTCIFYADDSQLYATVDPHDQHPALSTLQKCISEVIEWNTINKLVCNPSKTEVIQFSSRFVKNPTSVTFLLATLEYNHQTAFVILVPT